MTWIKRLIMLAGILLVGNGGYNAYQTNANPELTQEQRAEQWKKYGARPATGGLLLVALPGLTAIASRKLTSAARGGAAKVGESLLERFNRWLETPATPNANVSRATKPSGPDAQPLFAQHMITVDGARISIEYDEAKLSDPGVRLKICCAVQAALEVRTGDLAQ